jgi:hypothetical protein
MNQYFNFLPENFPNGSKAFAATLKNLVNALTEAFDLLPDLTTLVLFGTKAATSAGTANAYTATISGIEGLNDFQRILLKMHAGNTGPSTLNLSGLGARPIIKSDGTPLEEGDLAENFIADLIFNETESAWYLQGISASTLTQLFESIETVQQQLTLAQDILDGVVTDVEYNSSIVETLSKAAYFRGKLVTVEYDEDDVGVIDWTAGSAFDLGDLTGPVVLDFINLPEPENNECQVVWGRVRNAGGGNSINLLAPEGVEVKTVGGNTFLPSGGEDVLICFMDGNSKLYVEYIPDWSTVA